MIAAASNPVPRTLASVQMLRAVAALLVLLYHLATTAAFGWRTPSGHMLWPAAWLEAVGFAGVDLFFVISGVVMTYACYGDVGHPRKSLPFLMRRIGRIYPLYWFVTAAVLAACWLLPGWAAREKFTALNIAKSLTLWPQADFPIVAVGWTLTYEMFFYMVFAALIAASRRWFLPMLAVWSIATLAMFWTLDDPSDRHGAAAHLKLPLYASPLALEFIAGCVIGMLARRRRMPWAGASLACGVFALGVLGYFARALFPFEAAYGLGRVVVFGVSAMLIVYGAVGLELRGRLAPPRWIVFWGDASYSTYLTHMYVIWPAAWAWTWWNRGAIPAPSWFATVACLALCGLTAAACYRWIERPLNRAVKSGLNSCSLIGPSPSEDPRPSSELNRTDSFVTSIAVREGR